VSGWKGWALAGAGLVALYLLLHRRKRGQTLGAGAAPNALTATAGFNLWNAGFEVTPINLGRINSPLWGNNVQSTRSQKVFSTHA